MLPVYPLVSICLEQNPRHTSLAGRHAKVPSQVLREAVHLLKYSYAVYSLQPNIEHPGSCMDVLCFKPPDPQEVSESLGYTV
jgi:hypothetical protein